MFKKYPAVALLTAVVGGIVLGDKLSLPAWLWLVISVACAFAAIWFWARQNGMAMSISVLAALLFCSGFSYSYSVKTFPPGHIIHYADGQSQYEIYATVDDWPVIKNKYADIFAEVDSLAQDGVMIDIDGRILIHIGSPANFVQYGDRVILSGRLYPIRGGQNPNGFNYRRYLNLRSVFAVMYLPHQYGLQVDPAGGGSIYATIGNLRRQMLGVFADNLGTEAAALASGFLIGETRQIDASVYDLFRDTGTLHLLAVSGSNVGLVLLVFLSLLKASPLKRVGRTVFLLIIIVVFSFLSYNQPSVVRASLMAALVIMGRCFQRGIDYNNIVAMAALIILLVEPVQLFDVGFQLSFATAWGLIFIMPRLAGLFRSFHRNRVYRYIAFPLMVCVVAQVVSLPLSAYYFNRLPLISFLSNLVVVPLVTIAVVGELALLMATLALPILGSLVGSLLNPLLLLIIKLLKYFNSIGWALPKGLMPSSIWLFVYFALMALAVLAIRSLRARRILVFAIVVSLIGLAAAEMVAPDMKDEITILSVSSGYIAISQRNPSLIILADLGIKDYSYTEKIIRPLLDNWNIRDFEVAVVSGNYTTVREALELLPLSNGGRLYLPKIYAGMARDIADKMTRVPDAEAIVLLEKRLSPFSGPDPTVYLSSEAVVFSRGQTRVVFAGDEFSLSNNVTMASGEEFYGLVVPKVTKDHLTDLKSLPDMKKFLIIANRLDSQAGNYRAGDGIFDISSSNIAILSQVGAVSIVTQNGGYRLK